MRYTLLLHSDPSKFASFTPEQFGEMKTSFGRYIGSLNEAGVFVDTDWLQPSNTATLVSLQDGERRVQDGPFADTKEQLGGYFVLDLPDLDAAISWAEKCPGAQWGSIEIRTTAMSEEG